MDFNEALSELIDAIADVEEHGDAIDVLQNYEGERDGETDSEWKDKYLKLESEYKKRFKEKWQRVRLVQMIKASQKTKQKKLPWKI